MTVFLIWFGGHTVDRYDIFRRDMPPAYLRDCLIGLFEDYLSSAEFCADRFELTEAVNVLPFWRRALIEGRLRENTRSHRKMKVSCDKDHSGFWNHTVVSIGDCIMTQSSARHPDDLLRHSYARVAYAEPDNQRYLHSSFQPITTSRRGFVYGVLVHGRDPDEKFFPAFARIVFPNRNLTSNYRRQFDLFKEFPEAVRRCTSGIFEERKHTLERQFETVELPDPELRDDIGEVL
jgi:hypothetical protein